MDFYMLLDSSQTTQKSDDFTISFPDKISFNGIPHEIGVTQLATWFTWFNIHPDYNNQTFKYSNDGGVTWFTMTIPAGNYSMTQLEDAIHDLMKSNGHVTVDPITANETYDINFLPNYSTIRLYIEILGAFQLDLTVGNLHTILGFNPILITASQYGTANVNITNSVNTMILHCSLVNGIGTFSNGINSDILYSFVPDVPPGSNITINPVNVPYIPINNMQGFDRVRLRLTDQLGRGVSLNGEHLSCWLHVRPRNLLAYQK